MTTDPLALAVAIREARAAGLVIPCGVEGEYRLWTSDAAEQRALAVTRCEEGCTVIDACGAAADRIHATHGVWGGADYSERANQRWRKAPASTTNDTERTTTP